MKKAFILGLVFASITCHSFEKPPHCEAYDSIYSIRDGNAEKTDGTNFSNQDLISSSCVDGDLLNIEIGDLLNSWSKVNDNFLDQRSPLYQVRATKYALRNLAARASEFEGLAGAKGEDYSSELTSCLNQLEPNLATELTNKRIEEATSNQPLTSSFIQTSFDKAMLSSSVLNIIKKKKEAHEQELKELKSQKSSIGKETYKDRKEELEAKFEGNLNQYSGIVKQMSQTDPLLFSTQNNFSVMDWFNSQIIPSKVADELLGDVPQAIKLKLEETLTNEEDLAGLSGFIRVYGEELKDQINTYKASHLESNKDRINAEIKEAATQFVDDTNASMIANCKNNGDNLHFNNNLIAGLAESLYNEADLTPEQKKEELIALQAWHCHAWRKRPYEAAGGLNWKKVGGFASVGAGALMWLTAPVTGIGAVAGTYFMAAGGGILAATEVEDYFQHNVNLQQEKTGFQMGWRDLAKLTASQDQRTDIVTNIGTEIALGGVGVGLRLVRLPKFLQTGRVAKNSSVREGATPEADVDNYYGLIMSRHERVIPSETIGDKVNNLLKAATGNTTIPKVLLKEDGDFAPMIKIITDTKGNEIDKDIAFKDLQERIRAYKDYPDTLKSAVRSGVNFREIQDANRVYASTLKRSHFPTRKGDPVPKLPELDPPLKLSTSPNNTVVLHYQVVDKNADGVESIIEYTEDFANYSGFMRFVGDTKSAHKQAFSFDLTDETLRNSDIFNVLDDQARRYRELSVVRDSLIDIGKNVDPVTGKYPNLTDRQNGYVFQLNEILTKSPDLLPRRDALKAFTAQESKAERRALLTGNIFRNRGGKYSKEAKTFARQGLPSLFRTLAPIGILGGTFGGTGIIVTSASDRLGVRGLKEDFLETTRDFSRSVNKVFYPEAPVGFTNEEKACAQQARGWTVENACLLSLLNDQVMVREGIREQFDPNYDMATDEDLLRRVRQYIRDFYRLREFFAEGKKTQIAQSSMSMVAKEKAEGDLKEFIREVALNNGLVILDRGVISEDVADKLRERLVNYNDNPEDARKAYEEILEALASYQGQVIQNPELPSSIKNMVEKLMTEEIIDDLKTEQ